MTDTSYLTPMWLKPWMERRRLRDDLPFVPANSALMLIDLQRYFLDPEAGSYLPAGPAILPFALKLTSSHTGLVFASG